MIHLIVGGYGGFSGLRRWYNEEENHMAKKIRTGRCMPYSHRHKGGALSTVPAADLGAVVIREALKRAGVAPDQVDQVYMGCVTRPDRDRTWPVRLPSMQDFPSRFRQLPLTWYAVPVYRASTWQPR